MEKVKGVFSKIGSALKSHLKIVIAVVVVLIVAILAINLIGGSEKRAIKKYFRAINSYDKDKIVKAMDLEGALAWKSTDKLEDFADELDDVDDDDVDSAKDTIKEQVKSIKENKVKIKLDKIIYVATAKEDKNLKKVYIKYTATSKATDDDKEDAKDNDDWKGMKAVNETITNYATVLLYKNKVISGPGISVYASYSFDY
ncbi:MAG: hypothetical protein ACI4VN_06850 [Clostridia bacterium]